MACCDKPNRSDVHLSAQEEAAMEEATRKHFDALAPNRHSKPQRSDYSSTYTDTYSNGVHGDGEIPELLQFQRLEKDQQKLCYSEGKLREEFVETEYYKDLNCVDKQHHTTGTGFIEVEGALRNSFKIEPDSPAEFHASCKGNPATNEWIPAPADAINFISDKPSRSDN
nr:Maternal effect embryo arrest 59 [Ipomoea batatas]